MTIKAIMCDIDGTILSSKGYVSEDTVKAIKEVREKGVLFGLCTGRDVSGVQKRLDDWHLDGLVDAIIGSGGSEIYDKKHDIRKISHPLDGKYIKEIMKHFEDMDINFAIPVNGVFYTPKDDINIRRLSEADNEPFVVVDYDTFLKNPQLKVMITCDPSYMDKVVERSKTFHSEYFRSAALITASTLFEFMDPRVTKANGLKELMEMHGFTMEELCTFGDADNDYDMTLAAGVGVVMKNGSDKTKSVADFICDDNDHDGIAKFIKSHMQLFESL